MNGVLRLLGAARLGSWWKKPAGWKEVSEITAVRSLNPNRQSFWKSGLCWYSLLGILIFLVANKLEFGGVFLALLW